MKRLIDSKFWHDPFIFDLDPVEKLLFLYFLTNSHSNITGIYELSLRVAATETGIESVMIEKILNRLSSKMNHFEGFIVVFNFLKYQNINSPGVIQGIIREFGKIPKEVFNKAIAMGYNTMNLAALGASEVQKIDSEGTVLPETDKPILILKPILKPYGVLSNSDSGEPTGAVTDVPGPSVGEQTFGVFWAMYPRRQAKVKALASWLKLGLNKKDGPDETILGKIMASLSVQKQSPQWTAEDGKYIPMPATWLNQRRWEDETATSGSGTIDESQLSPDILRARQLQESFDRQNEGL